MGDLALAMRERCGFDSAEEAAPYAFQWVGEDGLVLPFDNIPGSTKQPSLNPSRAGRLSSRRRLCCGSFLLRGITPWSASAQEPSRTRKRRTNPRSSRGRPGGCPQEPEQATIGSRPIASQRRLVPSPLTGPERARRHWPVVDLTGRTRGQMQPPAGHHPHDPLSGIAAPHLIQQ